MARASQIRPDTSRGLRWPEGTLGESGPPGSHTRAAREPRFLHIDELGQLLRVSRSTAYAMVASGLIPSIRFSPRVVRVDRIELENWLASRCAR